MRIPEQQSQRERSRRAVTPRHRRALATGVIIVITTALSLMAGATTEFAASAVPVTEGSAINLNSGLIGAQAPTTSPSPTRVRRSTTPRISPSISPSQPLRSKPGSLASWAVRSASSTSRCSTATSNS